MIHEKLKNKIYYLKHLQQEKTNVEYFLETTKPTSYNFYRWYGISRRHKKILKRINKTITKINETSC